MHGLVIALSAVSVVCSGLAIACAEMAHREAARIRAERERREAS